LFLLVLLYPMFQFQRQCCSAFICHSLCNWWCCAAFLSIQQVLHRLLLHCSTCPSCQPECTTADPAAAATTPRQSTIVLKQQICSCKAQHTLTKLPGSISPGTKAQDLRYQGLHNTLLQYACKSTPRSQRATAHTLTSITTQARARMYQLPSTSRILQHLCKV
jgi:hypothetical protein